VGRRARSASSKQRKRPGGRPRKYCRVGCSSVDPRGAVNEQQMGGLRGKFFPEKKGPHTCDETMAAYGDAKGLQSNQKGRLGRRPGGERVNQSEKGHSKPRFCCWPNSLRKGERLQGCVQAREPIRNRKGGPQECRNIHPSERQVAYRNGARRSQHPLPRSGFPRI